MNGTDLIPELLGQNSIANISRPITTKYSNAINQTRKRSPSVLSSIIMCDYTEIVCSACKQTKGKTLIKECSFPGDKRLKCRINYIKTEYMICVPCGN